MSQSEFRIDTQSPAVSDQASQAANQALELLQRESRVHQQQINETSLLGQAFTGVTEFWHQTDKKGSQVEDLKRRIEADLAAGKTEDAARLAANAKTVVEADQAALKSRSEIAGIGSGTVQAVGLFMAGRRGYLVAGAAAALDAIKPSSSDSMGEQLTDIGLGITRVTALKGAYSAASKFNLGMATTAVGLGVGSRITDLALNRKTYLDAATGTYDAGLGLNRVVAGATDAGALTSDIVSLVVARGALGKLNQATDGALTNNKALSNMAVGAVFGLSKGSSDEVIRQSREGVFEPGKFLSHTLTSGATSLIGSAIGGAANMRAASRGEAATESLNLKVAPATDSLKIADARTNFPGSTSREYIVTSGETNVAANMARSLAAFSFLKVREVKPGGALMPEQNMLIQHGGKDIPLKGELAAKADLIASCDPASLPVEFRAKHIMPSVQESLWLSQSGGNRLTFAARLAEIFKPGSVRTPDMQPVPLGHPSVSELLQHPSTLDKLNVRGVHDLGLYSEVLKGFKTPAKRVMGSGADSVVLELADDNILKITHQVWRPEWGFRTYRNAEGREIRFDAAIIGKPQTFDRPDGMATYYIQERAQAGVQESTVQVFADRLRKDGRWEFWDRDFTQLGTIPLKDGGRGLVLLDYDAVRAPNLVPRDLKVRHEDRFDKEDRYDRW
ncbi:MAG: hypothetical protein JSS86_19985 [Cyanobacteria bacterium SZAS LIN-2]|nr:hypothetical protein [Cyanobacteria bacterium SZAS LIN-2]